MATETETRNVYGTLKVELRPKSHTVSDFGIKSDLGKFYGPGV
jgi:hypothetical protein